MLPLVLFGDNQFFGVNHMSEEKARAQSIRFQDISEIIRVLDAAYDSGIRVFMCTTHERVGQICDHVRRNMSRYDGLLFYPCMPYAHKYANAMTEFGPLEAVRRLLPEEGAFSALLQSGVSLARRDVEALSHLLIEAEMKMFTGLQTPVVFLQNVATDLLLGLDVKVSFSIFAEYVKNHLHAEPGFITMNLPLLLDALNEQGIDNPIVCANINKIGFRMSGGTAKYEQLLKERKFRPIAMSILASGAINAKEAVEYIAGLPKIESVVFGASSMANIRQTKELIDTAFANRASTASI